MDDRIAFDVLGSGFLGGQPCSTHELIGTPEIDRFAKLIQNPRLKLLALPDDPVLEIFVQASSNPLLLIRGQDTRRALILVPSILETHQAQLVVPLADSMRSRHRVFRDVEDVTHSVTVCQKRKKLRSSSLNGTGTSPVDRPEVLSLMLKLNRKRCPCDALE